MFQGSMVALVTPMHEDGAVDQAALKRLVEFHVEHGTSAIISVGTSGESATLDPEEHVEVIRLTLQYAAGRIPIIAGTGANATAEAIHLTRRAHEVGADACLLVTPYYNKPTQEGLYLHFKAVADAVPIPQILYNVPGRTACDMNNETVARLAKVPNIIGIKDATGDIGRVEDLIRRCDDEFEIYSGDDATALDLILEGGRGDISVTANVAPAAMQQMCTLALDGSKDEARELNARLMPLHKGLFVEANPIPVKWALQQMGMIGGGIRLPMTPLAAAYHDTVSRAMGEAGIL
ncbi:MAG: 4-hydroxy-tetrahydrodipicolinate synthase [Gammaproteobacteria bacterium]|nr:4-hydroxy-tetrahydrodipicolinate synthase [Gammaproteobacteria bacterium]